MSASSSVPQVGGPATNASTVLTAPKARHVIWQKLDTLRQRDNLVKGTLAVGMLGFLMLASWAGYGCSGRVPVAVPLVSTLATGAAAKFIGAADGAVRVFTRYLPMAIQLARSQGKQIPESGPTGIWTGKDVNFFQFFNLQLALGMAEFLTEEGIKSAWDFGCGPDEYSKVLLKAGIACNGLDGNPDTETISEGTALVQDLAVPFNREVRDCVISIEVGAKIPEQYADQFFTNIKAHAAHMAIISWPVKGQKGHHQLNTQDNGYVIDKMEALGWKLDEKATARLRQSANPVDYWFQDTLMVFRKKAD